MSELFDDFAVSREQDPDFGPASQGPGQGRRNGGQTADPDEVIHFRGYEQDFQKISSHRSLTVNMQERFQFLLELAKNFSRMKSAVPGAAAREHHNGFPDVAAHSRLMPGPKVCGALRGFIAMTIARIDEGIATGCFDALRVLDFSTTIAGPHCTRMLVDMGAEVIKVESVDGETMRTRPPMRGNFSSVFGQLNAGKKSLVLDLKSTDGVDAIRRLVATADILVENFRPGVMRRLRLDYPCLRELNPKLIYCSISGYGQTGPSAELPAYAPVIHAASGYDMAHLAYQPGRQRPDYCGIYHADVLTGVYAFGAISAALYQRSASGRGQHIDVSMLESMLSLTLNEVQWSQFEVAPPSRPMFGPMETADGYVMVAIASEKTFQGLVTAAGRPEWISDARFARYPDRRRHWKDLMEGVETWSRSVPTEKCLTELNAHGVPCSAYRTVAEAMADPQLTHRGALAEVEDGSGSFKVMNLPFRMSASRVAARKRVATLGEHTLSLLRESGLSDEAIAAFAGKSGAAERG
jgi:CoA:oxalate CoA-transferase